jgi:hypothetical protein
MAEFTGSNLAVYFKGTLISGNQREFSNKREMGLVDASAGADAARSYLTTLKDGTAKMVTLLQTSATATTDVPVLCVEGATGTLEWAPEGSASGKVRHYVSSAFVKSQETKSPYDDVTELSLEFQFSAAVSDGTYA